MFAVDLKGKKAWVTGGSRGIGAQVCRALARAGADVGLTYRSQDQEAADVAGSLREFGVKSLAVKADAAKRESVEEGYAKIKAELGSVDILVNCAGIIRDNLFIKLKEEDWQDVIQTNLFGTMYSCRAVVRDMMSNRWGRIINFSSVASERGGIGQTNYAASKGAVEAMTRTLACEVGRRSVTVNCIAPGVINTEMTKAIRNEDGEAKLLESQIIKRLGEPDEIAAWVTWLASDYTGFMTGQVVRVDGGLKLA